jgi:fatty acyl-CoA reductase
VAGWIDNMYGPTGIIVGVAAGLLHVLHIHKENNAEIVPVDLCVNSLLASAWDVARNSYEEPPIYNYVTSHKNPITWEEYTKLGIEYGQQIPLQKSIWYYTFKMSASKLYVTWLTFFYHIIPAMFMDFGLLITGKKPKYDFNGFS